MTTSFLLQVLLLLLLLASSLQVLALKHIPMRTGQSMILQNSIVQNINANPTAGWKAALNPYFTNHTVAQFKHMLGAKPTPQNALDEFPVVRHEKELKLPKQFDARTAWPQCTTIGKILG